MATKSGKFKSAQKPRLSAGLLARASRVAAQYQIVLHREDGLWRGRGLELPQVFGEGKSPRECVENTRESLAGRVATLLAEGEPPPAPACDGTRSQQVNIRLTAEEKLLLEAAAKRKGFKGLADFVRAAAIENAR